MLKTNLERGGGGGGGAKALRYSHMKNANSSSSTLISNTRQKWTDGKAWRYGQLFSMDDSQCKYSEGCISMWYSTCIYDNRIYNGILKCKRKKCRDDTVFGTYTCQCLSLPEIHSIFFLHCYLLLPLSLSSLTVIHCCFYLNQHTGKQRANLALSRKSQFCLCKTSEVWNNNETWMLLYQR